MASVWGELKRRNVVKVAVAYAIVGWLLIEITATVFPIVQLPEWTVTLVTMLLILGFPVALILSWAYELTPQGIERAKSVPLSESITRVTGRKLDFIIIGVLAIAVAVFAVERFVLVEEAPMPLVSTDDRRSIAVLPFDNRSAQSEDEFFVDGIHDDILTQLAKIGALKVISRTSVMVYRDVTRNMREIGEQLGVATILEGGVQRAGDTIRINAQLIDAETDEHLWAEIYDRELTAQNIFAIQSEIATSIAEELQATLSPQEVARLNELPTDSTRAYEFYLSGNEYARRTDSRTFRLLAIQMFQRAVAEDPEFALAWSALSRTHIWVYFQGIDHAEMRRTLALEAVERALALEPDLPEAHLAMGYYYYQGFRDYDGALREFGIAERGMPGTLQSFLARAVIHRRLGQWDAALQNFERALTLDPRRPFADHLRTYIHLREYMQAEQGLQHLLEIAPDNPSANREMVRIPLFRDGEIAPAKEAVENSSRELTDRDRNWFGWIVALYERDYDTATELLGNLESDVLLEEGARYLTKASASGVTYQLAGSLELAEQAFQAARAQIEAMFEATPDEDDARLYVALGEVLAGLGEPEEAAQMARRAMDTLPTSKDPYVGPHVQLGAIIRVLVPAGDHDAALHELDAYLSAPGYWSIEGLLPDPRLDPIRDDPRFQALVEKYSRQ